jgi:hypothetical protein
MTMDRHTMTFFVAPNQMQGDTNLLVLAGSRGRGGGRRGRNQLDQHAPMIDSIRLVNSSSLAGIRAIVPSLP